MPGPLFCFGPVRTGTPDLPLIMEIDMFQWDKSCAYDAQQKQRFHATARSRLKKLAAELGLPPGGFEIRSSKGGVAVSGEVTLHHTSAYIQVGQFGLSSGHGILIRTCQSGGPNHFVALVMLDDIPALAAAVRAITGVGHERFGASQFRAA